MKQIRRKQQAQQDGFFDTKYAYTVLEKGSVPKGVMSTTAHVGTLLGPTTYKDTVYIATDLNISTIPIM